MVPFLVFHDRRVNWRFLSYFLLFSAVIFLMGYHMWGSSVLKPVLKGAVRKSTMLSVFAFFRGALSPYHNIDYLSFPLTLSFLVLLFFLSSLKRFSYSLGVLLSLFVYHTFYLVGHHQFYLTSFLVFLYFLIQDDLFKKDLYGVRTVGAFVFFWIFLLSFVFFHTSQYRDVPFLADAVGLPTFLIQLVFVVSLLRYGLLKSRERPDLRIIILDEH